MPMIHFEGIVKIVVSWDTNDLRNFTTFYFGAVPRRQGPTKTEKINPP